MHDIEKWQHFIAGCMRAVHAPPS